MSLDDFLKGLSVFNQGMTDLATSTAINDANAQLQQLQSQEQDKAKLLQQQTAVSQDLSMRLAAVGANPSTIQELTTNIAPSVGAQYSAEQNSALQQSTQAFTGQQNALNRQLQRDLADKSSESMSMKMSAKDADRNLKFVASKSSEFQKMKPVETINTLMGTVDKLEAQLNDGSPLSGEMVANQMPRLAGEVGPLSDADKKPYKEALSLLESLRAKALKVGTGKVSPELLKQYRSVLQTVKQVSRNQLENYHKNFTTRAMTTARMGGLQIDENDFKTATMPAYLQQIREQEQAAQQQKPQPGAIPNVPVGNKYIKSSSNSIKQIELKAYANRKGG